jgi:ABC-type lipoprotein export system ATPase subunit
LLTGCTINRPQLSGGERQRVAIARAIISRPPLLLADEPTGNLDSKTSQDILELFVQIFKQSQSTLLLITHDREIAHQVSTTLIELQDGRFSTFSRESSFRDLSVKGS